MNGFYGCSIFGSIRVDDVFVPYFVTMRMTYIFKMKKPDDKRDFTKSSCLLIYLQVFGTTELPDKPIMLPPFVDSTHCLPYYLTRKGRAVADRVVSVLAYVCPDITFSPTIYPIAAILLHFMSGKLNFKSISQNGFVFCFSCNYICANFCLFQRKNATTV